MKKTLVFLGLAFLLIIPLLSFGQKQFTIQEAKDTAQSWRSDARDLWLKKNPTKQELDQSIKIYKKLILFLDSVPIKQLGEGSLNLKLRKPDIDFDLACAYAKAHRFDEALTSLDVYFNEGSSFVLPFLAKDTLFAEMRADPRFISMMDKFKARLSLYYNTAIVTKFQSDLPQSEKIAGLSLLWMKAKTNFVYFDHLIADWNQTYMDFIPQVIATKSTLEYYRVLQKFYAQLHDGHSNVYVPKDLAKEVNSRPPINTRLIEGKVFITGVYNDSLQKAGIIPGLEILKVDNVPVKEYADTYIKPYSSSPTPQDMDEREYNYSLLNGAAGKPVELELSDRKGKIIIKSIPRSGYPKMTPIPSIKYQEIDHIGYLIIYNFVDNRIVKQIDSLYTQIDKTKGLIIDIRDNGGGNSDIANAILGMLTDKPFETFASKSNRFEYDSVEPLWTENGVGSALPNKNHFYNKPTVLLVNAATFSAAEDFAVAFDYMKRGKPIGQTTAGSTGQPISFSLPGGGYARICSKRVTYPDGKEFVDIGIKPDIFVNPTINDFCSGTDAVLQKALEVLK